MDRTFSSLPSYEATNGYGKPPRCPPHIPLSLSLGSALTLRHGSELDPVLRPALDTDQSACLSLQVSCGSLMVPWRTSPNSATRGSCPSQTLPQAWTGLTWLMRHGPLKVTSLAEAAGTSCYPPLLLFPRLLLLFAAWRACVCMSIAARVSALACAGLRLLCVSVSSGVS